MAVRKLFTVSPRKMYADPVSDKRANTVKNIRTIESKPQTNNARKIFGKKISQKNDLNRNS